MAGVRPSARPSHAIFACALFIATALGAVPAAAQQSRGTAVDSSAPALYRAELDQLPVDRLRDALLFLPGVTAGTDSATLFQGSSSGATATYLDGIPVSRGLRGEPAGVRGDRRAMELGTNAIGSARIEAAGSSVRHSNAAGAFVLIETPRFDARRDGRIRFETDELWGGGNPLGYTRLRGSAGGPLGDRLGFFIAATLEGQKSAAAGHDIEDAPFFVIGGVDTVVANVTTGTPDTVFSFDAASRTPASSQSYNQLLGRIDYALGRGRLSLLGLASAGQQRTFDYFSLYNPAQHTGVRETGYVVGLSLAQPVGGSAVLEAAVSRQRDRLQSGPVGGDAFDAGALGLQLGALEFAQAFDLWLADDELVGNYRTVSGVRAPCIAPLGEPADCAVTDRVRNNAYAVHGFSESGGPSALLRHYQEDRTVLQASLLFARGPSHAIRVGGEYTLATAANYTHGTSSTAASDVWREQPSRLALYAEDRFTSGKAELVAGVRFESFSSGAGRPYFSCDEAQDAADGFGDGTCGGVLEVGERQMFPRISTSPTVIGAPDQAAAIDAILFEDEAHTALSPRVAFRYGGSDRTTFSAGYSHLAQVPDYGILFARVNTDIALTNASAVYGTDIGLERNRLLTGGVEHRFGAATRAGVTVFHRWLDAMPMPSLLRLYDPFVRNERDVRVWQMRDLGTVAGLSARAERDLGRGIAAGAVYTYQDGDAAWLRPHTLAATLSAFDGAVAGTFRAASGSSYDVCDMFDTALSDEPCAGIPEGTARLPALSSLDLRVSHTIAVGGRGVTLFADGRNLLSSRNLLRVFSTTGTAEHAAERAIMFASDSMQYAFQAEQNGLYDHGTASIDLTFGGAGAGGCGAFSDVGGTSAAADCVYLVRAEERYGDGDRVFSLAEQRAASGAFYEAFRGEHQFSGDPRRVRFGVQVGF